MSDMNLVSNEPVTPAVVDIEELKTPFPNLLSEFIYKRTYSRWVPEKGRRERWGETVDRYVEFIGSQRRVPRPVLEACRAAIMKMEVLPSMRALWSAGPAALRDNTCFYNCSFVPIDSLKGFSELLYILMCGTGVGFSIESQFVDNLPDVAPLDVVTKPEWTVEDSTEGWAEALEYGLNQWFRGRAVVFDYSLIRPAGSILQLKGGRASGPDPLRKLFEFAEMTILGAAGRSLKPLEAHDICCQIGEIVMVGGFRRAALISISDPEDLEMRHAKDWSKGSFPAIRYMSNNSSYWEERPSEDIFWAEWKALVESKSGERGFSIDSWHRRANRPKGMVRTNPCGEIGLRFARSVDPWTGEGGGGQFCNLTAAVMRSEDTVETFAEKVRLATWLGALQASFTDFPFLRPAWKEHCDQDRLLGVDITGQCDAPHLSQNDEAMTLFNRVAIETAAEAAAYLSINMPVAITCGKPSGNSSQLVDCASGFHPRFSQYYLRRVRIAAHDPLCKMIRAAGITCHPENGQEDRAEDDVQVWVAEFPVKAPKGAMLRDDETALESLDRYLQVMNTWMSERGHNQSVTIYVRDNEWETVGQWVYDHFMDITGISFLPFDGGNYRMAPYEEITEEQYLDAEMRMPEVDFRFLTMFEREDMSEGGQTFACLGGSCEL